MESPRLVGESWTTAHIR